MKPVIIDRSARINLKIAFNILLNLYLIVTFRPHRYFTGITTTKMRFVNPEIKNIYSVNCSKIITNDHHCTQHLPYEYNDETQMSNSVNAVVPTYYILSR